MTNVLKKTALAGAMALTMVAGVAAVPSTADARWGGGGFHSGFHGGGFRAGFGGFRGGWGGRGWAGRGWGGRGFGLGYGRGYGRGFGWRRGFGFAGYPFGCGPYRRFYGACRYYGIY